MKHRTILLIVLGCLLFALTACSDEDINFVQSMLEEWANAKNVNPQNKDGSINFEGVINAGASALGSGDDEVKAAIDAKGVVDSIKAADEAAEKAQKALKNGDAKQAVNLLDPVIKNRPNDWWLLNQRAVARLEAGDPNWPLDLREVSTANPARVLEHQRDLFIEAKERQLAYSRTGPGRLPMCDTYRALATVYDSLERVAQSPMNRETYSILASENLAAITGGGCR